MHPFKLQLIHTCKTYLNEKIQSLNAIMKEITDAANSETKSSAGDKHETSRAMMQLEQEKLGKQIQEATEQLTEFDKMDFTKAGSTVSHGSFMETNKGLFFIASSIGKIETEGKTVFVISHKSPLALALIGSKEKDTVTFNSVSYTIQSLY
ncbi:MAG: 3-oxoacyl-ACP synthase [Bacteroidota bacterium]